MTRIAMAAAFTLAAAAGAGTAQAHVLHEAVLQNQTERNAIIEVVNQNRRGRAPAGGVGRVETEVFTMPAIRDSTAYYRLRVTTTAIWGTPNPIVACETVVTAAWSNSSNGMTCAGTMPAGACTMQVQRSSVPNRCTYRIIVR